MKDRMTFVAVFAHSFFLQALWNFERMQNVGFVFGLMSFFRHLYPDRKARREAFLRHFGYFNTHPYLIGIVYGIVATLEKDMRDGKPVNARQIEMIRNNVAGPLAAIGDTFFWATWRPFSVLISIGITMLSYRYLPEYFAVFVCPVVFLFVYNVMHIPFRYWSLYVGYQLNVGIIEILSKLEFHYVVNLVRGIGVLVLGLIFTAYVFIFANTLTAKLVFIGVFLTTIFFGCCRLPPSILFYLVVLASVAAVFLKGYII
ncbi:MAG: PTS system mannose/fructose/sorbose family transporter subunit IID [Endomicrobiales bacterium]|nr:PTS system mannose/fructose/sorbose family transporter subunit IID [Endomicrobiales bacterium]